MSYHFLGLWALTLLVLLALTLSSRVQFGIPEVGERAKTQAFAVARGSYLDFAASLAFGLFLCFYIFLMFYKEDFAYHDSSILLNSTLLGKNIYPPISTESGRFFPLGHQEWNVVRHLTASPGGYHVLPVIQLLVVVVILLKLMNRLAVPIRLAVIFVLLISPSFVISFFDLVVPERNVLFWLAVFLLAWKYFSEFGRRWHVATLLVAVHCSLYYKEPVFLLFGGFSAMRLALCAWFDWNAAPRKRFSEFFKKNKLDFAIIGLSLVFLEVYLVINISYRSMTYADERSVGILLALITYVRFDFLLDLFLIAFLVRIAYLIFAKIAPDPLWEPLAVGALLYFVCLVVLRLFGIYYTAPVDLVAALYLAEVLYCLSGRVAAKLAIAALALVVAEWHITLSLDWIAFSKDMIEGRAQLAAFLREYAKSRPSQTDVLVFGDIERFVLNDVFSFFKYKGLRLGDSLAQPQAGEAIFLVKSLKQFSNSHFEVRGEVFQCVYEMAPLPEELVIVLPDEEIPTARLSRLLREATILFHYRPLLASYHHLREGVIPGETTRRMDAYVFRMLDVHSGSN